MSNPLYPIFLHPDKISFIIAGGGEIADEKLTFLLKNSPDAKAYIISQTISEAVYHKIERNENVQFLRKSLTESDLHLANVIIGASKSFDENKRIYDLAKKAGKLVNIADTPALCDFYMGSIVSRGDLKIAISSNGKSPILISRLRQILEETLPNDTNEIIQNLNQIRDKLTGNFRQKLQSLKKITEILITPKTTYKNN